MITVSVCLPKDFSNSTVIAKSSSSSAVTVLFSVEVLATGSSVTEADFRTLFRVGIVGLNFSAEPDKMTRDTYFSVLRCPDRAAVASGEAGFLGLELRLPSSIFASFILSLLLLQVYMTRNFLLAYSKELSK